jgi:hypothetical protein
VYEKIIESPDDNDRFQIVKIDLSNYKGKEVIVRLYQNVDVADKWTGNAYWKKITIQ